MSKLQLPGRMGKRANMRSEWLRFKQEFEWYSLATNADAKPDRQKTALLLSCGGPLLMDIYNAFKFQAPTTAIPEPNMVFKDVLERLDRHFERKSNQVAASFAFWTRSRQPDESVEDYIVALKNLVKECGYEDPERMVRDNLTIGINDEEIRKELFMKGSALTLAQAEEIAVNYVSATEHNDLIEKRIDHAADDRAEELHAIARKNSKDYPPRRGLPKILNRHLADFVEETTRL
jgi:hypothetical protein